MFVVGLFAAIYFAIGDRAERSATHLVGNINLATTNH